MSSTIYQTAVSCADLLKHLFTIGAFENDPQILEGARLRLSAYDEARQTSSQELEVEDYKAKQNRINQRIRLITLENFGVEVPGSTLDEALDSLEAECQRAKKVVGTPHE
jgi:hypothetical protein